MVEAMTAKFTVYHWDTFDNDTFVVGRADTLDGARRIVKDHYGERVRPSGADRVDIVDDQGNVVEKFNVG